MNKQRRKILEDIIERLDGIKTELDDLYVDEYGAYENLPEGIQDSERGQVICENATDIESASSEIEDIVSSLQDIIER